MYPPMDNTEKFVPCGLSSATESGPFNNVPEIGFLY